MISHTLARNDQPFGGLVLRQVEPFVDKMLITISRKSNDGTIEVVENFAKEFKDKVDLNYEAVANFSDLTRERQKQIDKTPPGEWVLFLDMDDVWEAASLKDIIQNYLHQDVDALAVKPYQVIDQKYYDLSWENKYFTKFFKNQPGLHYKYPWPHDCLFLKDKILYWKKNPRVPCIRVPYFHLSNIKYSSFRKQKGWEKYDQKIGTPYFIPERHKDIMEKIYEQLRG